MTTYTTVTGREIKVSVNYSKKTFTVITESGKYRTLAMNKNEFQSNIHNTGNDWNNFLKGSDYYKC